MLLIYNRNSQLGSINGKIAFNRDVMLLIADGLKKGIATKLVDTNETLMYRIENTKEDFSEAAAELVCSTHYN